MGLVEGSSITLKTRISPAAFLKLCARNPELRMERSARGELEIMSPASSGTGGRNFKLTTRLGMWVEGTGLEKAFDSSAGFTLPNGAVRSPDASWIALERWELLTADQKEEGFAPICPDFVVELRSKHDSLRKLKIKMREYISQGARLGWLIDPKSKCVTIYRLDRVEETLISPTTLSGEDVLPGFVLDLKGILI